jgi:WD40 repeat protein
VGHGLARVTVSFDDWKPGNVAPSRHQMPVVRPKYRLVLEPVSPRLSRELIHPNREATLAGIRFSPDGRRIIAGSYPEGVIQVWDVESGRQLAKIESGYRHRSSDEYFFVSPDWRTVYVARETETRQRIERDGKKLNLWEFDSDIRAWDLTTGELKIVFAQSPVRGIGWMSMSPDGQTLLAGEQLPGESEGRPHRAVSLVDTRTGKSRELAGNLSVVGAFSPDSRMIAIHEMDVDSYATGIRVFDVATGQLSRSIPIREQFADAGRLVFSPDGQLLVFPQRLHSQRGDWQHWNSILAFYDVASGVQVASIPLDEKNSDYGKPQFSPDGRTLVTGNWRANKSVLLIFDVAQRKLAHTVSLSEEKAFIRPRTFSPDSRWMAVGTQFIPEELQQEDEPAAENVPQPRIHLVDVATGKICETLVTPQGFASSGSFSPDGKTLATAGNGRVLLWDLSVPPGE